MAKRKSNAPQFLTETQVARLLKCADCARDKAAILIIYRHGLRAGEMCGLEWSDLDLNAGTIKCHRLKSSTDSVHPLQGDEMRALKQWRREQEPASKYVLTGQRGIMTPNGLNRLIKIIAARDSELPPVHVHMLRHACGYALANAGHDTRRVQHWLGHANIQNTVRYTQLAPNAFKGFWR